MVAVFVLDKGIIGRVLIIIGLLVIILIIVRSSIWNSTCSRSHTSGRTGSKNFQVLILLIGILAVVVVVVVVVVVKVVQELILVIRAPRVV